MLLLPCPTCGKRNASEFRFGGEVLTRPDGEDDKAWSDYLYMRKNEAGISKEWWFHRSGCGQWLLAERNTRTNQVISTSLPGGAS